MVGFGRFSCRAQPDPRRPASKEVLGTLTVRMGEIYISQGRQIWGTLLFFCPIDVLVIK